MQRLLLDDREFEMENEEYPLQVLLEIDEVVSRRSTRVLDIAGS